MNEEMTPSEACVNLIKHFEGCKERAGQELYKAYLCPAKVLSIGWGHTNLMGRRLLETDVWTISECDRTFGYDLTLCATAIKSLTRARLTQKQFDALTSFVYNVRADQFAKSTLLAKINRKDYGGAASEILRWNKTGGKVSLALSERRQSEAHLFLGQPDKHYDGSANAAVTPMQEPMPRAVDPPGESDDGDKRAKDHREDKPSSEEHHRDQRPNREQTPGVVRPEGAA